MIDQSRSIYITIREQIFEALEAEAVTTLTKSQLSKQLANAIDVLIERQNLSVATIVREEFVKSLVDELHGLGPLQTLMDDESISDIMITTTKTCLLNEAGL